MKAFHDLKKMERLFYAKQCPLGMAGAYCADYANALAKYRRADTALFEYECYLVDAAAPAVPAAKTESTYLTRVYDEF